MTNGNKEEKRGRKTQVDPYRAISGGIVGLVIIGPFLITTLVISVRYVLEGRIFMLFPSILIIIFTILAYRKFALHFKPTIIDIYRQEAAVRSHTEKLGVDVFATPAWLSPRFWAFGSEPGKLYWENQTLSFVTCDGTLKFSLPSNKISRVNFRNMGALFVKTTNGKIYKLSLYHIFGKRWTGAPRKILRVDNRALTHYEENIPDMVVPMTLVGLGSLPSMRRTALGFATNALAVYIGLAKLGKINEIAIAWQTILSKTQNVGKPISFFLQLGRTLIVALALLATIMLSFIVGAMFIFSQVWFFIWILVLPYMVLNIILES